MVLRQGLAALFATLLISFACAAAEAPSIGADPLPLAKPEDVGMSSERLAGIGAALRRISIAASHRAAPSQSPDAPPTSASALDSRSSRHWHHSDDGIGGVVLVAGREGYQ